MMEAISRKKMHIRRCRNSTEENMKRYTSMKNNAKKLVSKAMRVRAKEWLTEFNDYLNGI